MEVKDTRQREGITHGGRGFQGEGYQEEGEGYHMERYQAKGEATRWKKAPDCGKGVTCKGREVPGGGNWEPSRGKRPPCEGKGHQVERRYNRQRKEGTK